MHEPIGVAFDSPLASVRDRAERLAGELGLPLADPDAHGYALLLTVTDQRLELREAGRQTGPVYVDFITGPTAARRKRGGLTGDPLVRAVGAKGGTWVVWDVTAGLGRDAFLLAASGCSVTMVERSPVIAAVLEDGLARLGREPAIGAEIAPRLTLLKGDARHLLTELPDFRHPDAIYIDPMFPHRAKSALSKKEMRLCRRVAGDDPDAGELFEAARARARHRVVVKRWLHAPLLGPAPSIQYKGQSVRYDVYLTELSKAAPC